VTARIHIRFTEPGTHSWPGAPPHRSYLIPEHRHLFHFEVVCEVRHGDREIEFHDLRDQAVGYLREAWPQGRFGSASCEMIAGELGRWLAMLHFRRFSVTVWEDGEFGATADAPGPGADTKKAPSGLPDGV
jgi:hypothetical protein